MARYKYSENAKEVTDIYFDTETHGEFMGMEQGGEMKKVTTARIKEKLLGEIAGRLDTLEGSGYTEGSLKSHEDRLDTLEGTGEGSVAKAIDDAVSPIAEVVDTNRLYSASQYLALKAKADSLQVKCNTLQAEVYTDAPILQYGAVEIIGDGYEADDTPIDVSANVVDGSLDMEQKGLTITNLVENGDAESGTTSPWVTPVGALAPIINGYIGRNMTSSIPHMISEKNIVINGHSYAILCDGYFEGGANNCTLAFGFGEGMGVLSKVTTASSIIKDGVLHFAKVLVADADYSRIGFYFEPDSADATFAGVRKIRCLDLTSLGLSTITDTDILAQLLPYVDGTKSVGKMGIQILDADDVVTQTIFLPAIGNSLPNGVADSIKTVSDGWEHTKRVSDGLRISSSILWNVSATQPDDNGWKVFSPSLVYDFVSTTAFTAMILSDANEFYSYISGINVAVNYQFAISGGSMHITIPKSRIGTDSPTQQVIQTYFSENPHYLYYQLATPITTHYDLPLPTSGKTIHRFAGEEKIALYGTGLTFSENVLTVLSAIKFVAGVMTDITSLATITTNTVTFSGVSATDVVYVKVEHDVNRPLGILEHTPAVSNTASRLASLESRVTALEA